MNLLAIETATETCSVALSINGEVRERYVHVPRHHAEFLLPWVGSLLADAGISLPAVDAIAFSRGPGSFVSLRLGIGVVQGLAWSVDRPVIPISSLAATAQSALSSGSEHLQTSKILVALDARMNEVFSGLFEINADGVLNSIEPEQVCSPESIVKYANEDTLGVGIGFERYELLTSLHSSLGGLSADIWPKASSVLTLAEHWLESNDPLPADQAQPVYLRNDVAKKSTKQ